ncbi:hypothetical protein GCM10025771_31440 [Niveibacterium umoris]|uniref:Immunity MXAN-0049 protein domain-containing protein n=1 Tax=Niveibacterium umoris TaxID=1193620 RepID=A0A840BF54_9RHOO|nr:DUF1629 domain-containing protein [Niveibacterium umoris]MBB4011660.1 hypothetical protein [Niveibacterium umoris]
MGFSVWTYSDSSGACSITEARGLDPIMPLKDGSPALSLLSGASLVSGMNPDQPDDIALLDNVHNTDGILVVSARLKTFLKSQDLTHVEYLPLTVEDHKGRAVSEPFFVVHPLQPVDAIDLEASGCRMSRIKKDRIQSMEKMVLRTAEIPADRQLFRLKGLWGVTLVRESLAQAITAAGFTGLRWLPIDAYPG